MVGPEDYAAVVSSHLTLCLLLIGSFGQSFIAPWYRVHFHQISYPRFGPAIEHPWKTSYSCYLPNCYWWCFCFRKMASLYWHVNLRELVPWLHPKFLSLTPDFISSLAGLAPLFTIAPSGLFDWRTFCSSFGSWRMSWYLSLLCYSKDLLQLY